MPVGAPERAISARTAGVVRAFVWIESIRPLLPSRILARGRRSATRTPRSPNAPDPNNVPLPDTYYYRVMNYWIQAAAGSSAGSRGSAQELLEPGAWPACEPPP